MTRHAPFFALAAFALAALSACGGTGDSGQQLGNAIAISSANQTSVARAAISGGLSITQTQSSAGIASTGSGSASAAVARTHALSTLLAAAGGRRVTVASASAQPSAASSSSAACAVSGSTTSTFDDRDNSGTSTSGDVVTIAFNNCSDTTGSTINGTLVLTLTATPSATQVAASAAFQNVVLVDSGVTTTINGSASLVETDSGTEVVDTLTIGSAGLTVALASSAYTDSVAYASGTRIVTDDVSASGTTSSSVDGTFTTQSLGGSLTLATLAPLVQLSTDSYPSSGQVRVTGASTSTLLITVLNATQVQLQLDADGNGVAELSTSVNWSTLVP